MRIIKDRDQERESLRGRLSLLNEAVRRIKESLEREEVLQEVVKYARALTDAHFGAVAILRDCPIEFRVNWGPVGEEFPTWVDLTGNAYPTTPFYTITGLDQGKRYKVQVRARYDGYSGDWSETVEAAIAPASHRVTAVDTRVIAAPPTDSPPFRKVGALSLVSRLPGELTVSWDAPNDPGQPHDLFTAGLSVAEHQRLEETPGGLQFFTYLNMLSEPLRIPDFRSHPEVKALLEFSTLPMNSFLAAPIRHQGIGVACIFLGKAKGGQEFTQEDEEILALLASLAAIEIANSRRYKEAQQARVELDTVLETSPVGVAVFNAYSGGPRSLNKEALRIIHGLDLSNRPLKQLLDNLTVRWPDRKEALLSDFVIAQSQRNGESLRAEELVLSLPAGRSLSVLVNASIMSVPHDEVKSVVVTIQDLTWAEELEKLRAEFLGMVSHELRSPLTSIKGSAVTLRESLNNLGPTELVQLVGIIEMQADRMRDLISELLDVARIETGSLSVSPEPSDVVLLVEDARKTFLSGGGRDNVFVDLEPKLSWVMADRWRIVQVLDNLLSNAAKYSPEPSAITVGAALDDGLVAISVSDRGRGVPPERIPYLFRKFARNHSKEGELEIKGSGLGLAICKGIVEAHGGRIWAESAGPGRGTKFTFTLPVVDEESGNRASRFSPPLKETEASERGPKRILAVDDEPRSLMQVRKVLSEAGYAPIVTGNPEEVINIVRSDQPHLILLDLMLPGSDGIELMKHILATTELPVIFLSAYGRDEIIASALEAGAVDYIVKPFSPTELVARVRAALRRPYLPAQTEPAEPFVLGDLIVNYAERRVNVAGRPILLTVTEYNLLSALSTNAGRVLTHSELLQKVWNMDHSSDNGVIRTYVRRLRRKLGDNADNPTFIFAEPRVGYRMPKE